MLRNLKIYILIRPGKTPSVEEDFLIWLKVSEQLLNVELILSTNVYQDQNQRWQLLVQKLKRSCSRNLSADCKLFVKHTQSALPALSVNMHPRFFCTVHMAQVQLNTCVSYLWMHPRELTYLELCCFVHIECSWPFTLKVILIVPQLVSSLDSRLNSTGELGDTSGAGRYQFFLQIHQNTWGEEEHRIGNVYTWS